MNNGHIWLRGIQIIWNHSLSEPRTPLHCPYSPDNRYRIYSRCSSVRIICERSVSKLVLIISRQLLKLNPHTKENSIAEQHKSENWNRMISNQPAARSQMRIIPSSLTKYEARLTLVHWNHPPEKCIRWRWLCNVLAIHKKQAIPLYPLWQWWCCWRYWGHLRFRTLAGQKLTPKQYLGQSHHLCWPTHVAVVFYS